jgi:hypothetical protein
MYQPDVTGVETSAHTTVWPVPAPNGAAVMFYEEEAPARAVEHTRNKKNKRLIRWILLPLAILGAAAGVWFWI